MHTGVLSSGDGGTEAARLLGMLDVANDTTMEAQFSTIESRIGPFIVQLAEEIAQENLIEEVRAGKNEKTQHDNDLYKNGLHH